MLLLRTFNTPLCNLSAAKVLQDMPCPLRALLEAVWDDPTWWTRQLKQAAKAFQADLDHWVALPKTDREVPDEHDDDVQGHEATGQVFPCDVCGAIFPLRKHLAVHESRMHGLISPTRLLAPGPTCIACLRHYGTVERLQYHLKRAGSCLYRSACLMPPLTMPEVADAERTFKAYKRRVAKGHWEDFHTPTAACFAAGPKQLTASERVECEGEGMLLSTLSRLFHPCPVFLRRIEAYNGDRSQEGPRRTAARFWDRRPR